MNAADIVKTQRELDRALKRLEALVNEHEGILGSTLGGSAVPPDHAVDDLLQRLGDDGPVDDFEAGRRPDRRRHPR